MSHIPNITGTNRDKSRFRLFTAEACAFQMSTVLADTIGDGTLESQRIGIRNPRIRRKTECEPCHPDPCPTQHFRDISGGGITVHIGRKSQKNLGNRFSRHPFAQLREPKFFRSHTTGRGEFAAERMVAPPETAGSFNRNDIGRLFNHAQHGTVAKAVRTKTARIAPDNRERSAPGTAAHFALRPGESFRKRLQKPRRFANQSQSRP